MDSALVYIVPVTAIIPTANRSEVLERTLNSIANQICQPAEIIIVDASEDDLTKIVASRPIHNLLSLINYKLAESQGAAIQRNQAFRYVNEETVLFMDDDIILERNCIQNLWKRLQEKENIGGVNAMVTNQRYHAPGRVTSMMYRFMSGKDLPSYAGKCIGPAWNLLPADDEGLPLYNKVDWLNTTCTMYRKAALPNPPFSNHFFGYSLMEDLALSLEVAKKWTINNVRNAKIFHDSQVGVHKSNIKEISKMELINRHYIMVKVMGKSSFADYFKLFIFEIFGICSVLTNIKGWKNLIPTVAGKFIAVAKLSVFR